MADLRKRIESARSELGTDAEKVPQTADERARWWQAHMSERGIDLRVDLPTDVAEGIASDIEHLRGRVVGEEEYPDGSVEPIYENDAEALRFADIVYGRALPISRELDRFLAEKEYPARTADKFRRAVRRLEDYPRARFVKRQGEIAIPLGLPTNRGGRARGMRVMSITES